MVSAEGLIRVVSPGLRRTRGEDLVGKPCHPALFRRDSDCIDCQREKVLATGQSHHCWIPERRPGRFGHRQLLVQMRMESGDLLEVIVDAGPAEGLFPEQIFRERVLAEGLRHVPAGVFLLDSGMRIVNANPAAARLTGAGLEELRGRELNELLPPETLPARGAQLAELLASKAAIEIDEIKLDTAVGQRIVRASLAAVHSAGGGLSAAVGIVTDVTRERRVGLALQRKLGELSILREIDHVLARTVRLDQVLKVILAAVVHPKGLALSRGVLFLCEAEGSLIRGRLARSAPTSRRGVAGTGLGLALESWALDPPGEEDQQLEAEVQHFALPLGEGADNVLAEALEGGHSLVVRCDGSSDSRGRLCLLLESDHILLAPLVTPGRRLGVLAAALGPGSPSLDEDFMNLSAMIAGTAAGAIERARLHDELSQRLTDLHQAHARLRHLQGELLRAEHLSALGELSAEIVHQIRNPLAVVGGFARRLANATPEEDPRWEDVRIVAEEAERMEAILERIRQDVRLARSMPKESVPPAELLDAAMARYRELARAQRISLEVDLEQDLPPVRGSRDVLLEVLDNLLRNAFDAVQRDGRVRVSARRLKDAVHLLVEDDGPGLTAEQMEKIFEPFYTTKVRGTGLGLPLARRLVTQCGGSLSVDTGPGKGAAFRIVLPTVEFGPEPGRKGDGQGEE